MIFTERFAQVVDKILGGGGGGGNLACYGRGCGGIACWKNFSTVEVRGWAQGRLCGLIKVDSLEYVLAILLMGPNGFQRLKDLHFHKSIFSPFCFRNLILSSWVCRST